jgi:hypothetical protein
MSYQEYFENDEWKKGINILDKREDTLQVWEVAMVFTWIIYLRLFWLSKKWTIA